MLDVVFALECGDVGAAQGLTTVVAQQVEAAEVVRLAERVLPRGLLGDREELGGYNLAAVLDMSASLQKRENTQSPNACMSSPTRAYSTLEAKKWDAYMAGEALQVIGSTQCPDELAGQALAALAADLAAALRLGWLDLVFVLDGVCH